MGYSEPFIGKRKSNINTNKESMLSLLETAIMIQETNIDEAIDSLIEKKIKSEKNK